MVQTETGGNLAGTSVHKDNKEAGKYHGQRIKFGHPGNQYCGKALPSCNGGSDGVIDTSYQEQSHQTTDGSGKHHRTDDNPLYLDTHIFCGIFALTHNTDFITMLTVVEINIHKNGDNNCYDDT